MKTQHLLLITLLLFAAFMQSCNNSKSKTTDLQPILDEYWNEFLELNPIAATGYGDNRFNDLLQNDISQDYLHKLDSFYVKYLNKLKGINPSQLNENDHISYEILKREMELGQKGRQFPSELLPINQFDCLPLSFAQLGSGEGIQPFDSEKDYRDFLKRMKSFSIWMDTAIENMNRGIAQNIVLPKDLTLKVIQQYESIITSKADKSLFFKPCLTFPDSFDDSTRSQLTRAYKSAIDSFINPAYAKMVNFLKQDYLPHSRNTDGYNSLPDGNDWYNYYVEKWTTTNMKSWEILDIGKNEVDLITKEMEKVKSEVHYEGDLKSFFEYCNSDPQFMPFSTAQEVLDSFENIYGTEKKHLKDFFDQEPKTKFEIRQTEKFREATASAEYQPASEDGSRPGIFYCPVPNPKKFNAIGMETLFLHEAIPGHHYQCSLQQENDSLPKFRKFIWYGAYGEGWALYAETLGKDLGLFTNPYQYLGHLSDAMLRAVRLVVDVSIHTGQMSREDAINYMTSHMRISNEEATQEVERYMANPGQALSYMIGKKKIISLRDAAKARLGNSFDIKKFHNVVLRHGCLPLSILEEEVNKM